MANLVLKNIAKVCATALTKAPGIIDKIYVAPVCDFLALQKPDPANTDIDTYGVIDTAHTFTSPKGFVLIDDIQENTGKFNFSRNGGKGFGNFKCAAEMMGRTLNPKLIGMLNQMVNQPVVAIVVLMSGQRYQIGSEEFPAYITGEFDSLTNQSTEVFGTKISVEADQPLVTEYEGGLAITVIT